MTPYPLTITNKVLVALNPPRSIPTYIIFCRAIHTAMTNDARFASLAAKLTAFETNINKLDDNELASKLKQPTCTIAERDASKVVVKTNLDELVINVQLLANADPANAEVIIKAAGMGVRHAAIRQKQKNTAKDGAEAGSVDLTAEGEGPHNWRMSKDEVSWTILLGTLGSTKKVKNLNEGERYYFQNAIMQADEDDTEWSDSVKIILKKYSV